MRGHSLASHARVAAAGLLMGFSLSRIGFSDYREVHRMLTFADLRMTLAFAAAVALLAGAFASFGRGRAQAPRPVNRGCVLGGLLFGAGWALSGACPAIATTKESGMGMGLTISQTIVTDHDGKIRAESWPGRGAMLIVELSASTESQTQPALAL